MKTRTLNILWLFLSVFFSSTASESECIRSPQKEGWSWINAIEEIEPGKVGISLRQVHDSMHKKNEDLQRTLSIDKLLNSAGGTQKNLLLCRISLILKPKNKPAVEKVFSTTRVFENHLFIAGNIVPISADVVPGEQKKQKPTSVIASSTDSCLWKPIDVKVARIFLHTSHIYSRETAGGPADEQIHIISFDRYRHSDFYDKKKTVLRTCLLYKGLPYEEASKKARLARQWVAILESKAQNNDAAIIQWYEQASKAPNLHNGSSKSGESQENFFDGDHDSEQHFLYYVNDITDCLAEFKKLNEIISKIILYIESMPSFRAGQIREFMNGDEESVLRDEGVKTLREKFENRSFITDANKQKVVRALETIETSLGEEAKKKAKSLKGSLKLSFEPIGDKSFLEDIQGLSSDIGKKSNQCGTKNFENLKTFVEQVRGIAEKIHSETSPPYSKLINTLEDLKEMQDAPGFKVDPSIITFDEAADKAVTENKEHLIDTIVLHLHNTLDCCANCAPDLAQELRVEGRFVGYFKDLAQGHNTDKSRPRFMILASCGQERPDKWCKNCRKPHDVELNSDNSRFYQQRCYRENQKEITHKGVSIIDPANSLN